MPNPIVNINGSTRKALVDQQIAVARAIDAAMDALTQAKPHPRDYLGDKERLKVDMIEHAARFKTLHDLHTAVHAGALAIHKGGEA